MKFDNVNHIFFDLDHTLWDFDKNSGLTFESIFKEENIEIGLDHFLETYVPINHNYWELYRKNEVSKESLRLGRLKDSFDALKMDVSYEVINTLSERYINVLPNYNHLLDGCVEILEYLKSNYQLHIITNGFDEIQHTKLVNSKIAPYFHTVTTSEEAGVKKPHSKIFEMALEKSKARPENSLMIGDNFEADILGAYRAGIMAIYFDYYNSNENLEFLKINKLKQLRSYL